MVSVVATTAPAVVLPRRRRGFIKDGFSFETVERLGQWTAGCAGSRAGSSVCLEGGRSWPSPGEEVAAETEPGVPFKSTPRAIHALVTRRPFGIARSHDGVFAAAARHARNQKKNRRDTPKNGVTPFFLPSASAIAVIGKRRSHCHSDSRHAPAVSRCSVRRQMGGSRGAWSTG